MLFFTTAGGLIAGLTAATEDPDLGGTTIGQLAPKAPMSLQLHDVGATAPRQREFKANALNTENRPGCFHDGASLARLAATDLLGDTARHQAADSPLRRWISDSTARPAASLGLIRARG